MNQTNEKLLKTIITRIVVAQDERLSDELAFRDPTESEQATIDAFADALRAVKSVFVEMGD